eukprot:Gregarina_sp_Pseudo_9__1192@NODE_1785_length_1332_cov_378_901005_g1654_i0_p1_GENE_NODE_1785_length_1332_cov_378_901005_g1654_i0NODE_1785_length_1332_cov_378_901005_g1654_i0_p1_ORF_typecomplete_len334_score49_88YrhK/PF14145_6/73YrhK/PF14145_6/2_4YrhK/PF14145_6/1_5e07DUF872/PF05915_12/47DUF872/PF05915_12/14DUF872/PF05915_12/2_1DUF423/PF04241_15/1DUF423/PF04241_15/51DUF423/PF04241_15/1_9e02_NODE_1785_length_1332_cov_378_901005_g1654_i02681269
MSTSFRLNKSFEASTSLNQGAVHSGPHTTSDRGEKFWLNRASTKTDWHILVRCFLNLIGATGFLVGSIGWIADFLVVGTFLFAGANAFYAATGVWWAVSTRKSLAMRIRMTGSHAQLLEESEHEEGLPLTPLGLIEQAVPRTRQVWPYEEVTRAFTQVARVEVMAAICQIAGAVGFSTGCFLSLDPEALFETNFLYLFGSVLFLAQGIIGQLMCGSVTGPLLPLWPKAHRGWRTADPSKRIIAQRFVSSQCCDQSRVCMHRIIPGALLNTLGSLLFTIASFALFYEEYAWLGGWGYTFGSLLFVIATLADINGFLDALAIRLLQQEASFLHDF